MWRRKKADLAKGAAAGLVGGLAASFAMNQFQALLAKSGQRTPPGGGGHDTARHGAQEQKRQEAAEEPATVKAAAAISNAVDYELGREKKEPAGNLVHYVFGGAAGVLYGIAAEKAPAARAGFGTVFGAGLWVAADGIAVPAFGLSKEPREYPASVHLSALASHLVYGITLEGVRRVLRA
jgi:putative membrane protein